MCRACCAITGLWDRLRSMWLTDYGQCHWPTTVNVTGRLRSMWLTDYGQCDWPTTVNVTDRLRSMSLTDYSQCHWPTEVNGCGFVMGSICSSIICRAVKQEPYQLMCWSSGNSQTGQLIVCHGCLMLHLNVVHWLSVDHVAEMSQCHWPTAVNWP